jgi:hypothetical protein
LTSADNDTYPAAIWGGRLIRLKVSYDSGFPRVELWKVTNFPDPTGITAETL